jgi:hypothetical protein
MKGLLSRGRVSMLIVGAALSMSSSQTPLSSPFFNAGGDTREIDTAVIKDSVQATNPSVPLGYPMPSAAAVRSGIDPLSSKRDLDSKKAFISYAASTKTLTLIIPKAQNVNVSAHVLNGQTISRFSTRKFLTAGSHTIRLDNAALSTGVIVFSLEGEGFSLVKKINLTDEH